MILARHITMWSSLFIIIPHTTSSFLCYISNPTKKKISVDSENLADTLMWNSTSCTSISLIWKLIFQHFIFWHSVPLFLFHVCISLCTAANNLGRIASIWWPVMRKTCFLLYVDLLTQADAAARRTLCASQHLSAAGDGISCGLCGKYIGFPFPIIVVCSFFL